MIFLLKISLTESYSRWTCIFKNINFSLYLLFSVFFFVVVVVVLHPYRVLRRCLNFSVLKCVLITKKKKKIDAIWSDNWNNNFILFFFVFVKTNNYQRLLHENFRNKSTNINVYVISLSLSFSYLNVVKSIRNTELKYFGNLIDPFLRILLGNFFLSSLKSAIKLLLCFI